MLDFWYPEKLDQGGGLLQEGRQSGGVGPIQPLARSASGARWVAVWHGSTTRATTRSLTRR